jgi:hypothetical protein
VCQQIAATQKLSEGKTPIVITTFRLFAERKVKCNDADLMNRKGMVMGKRRVNAMRAVYLRHAICHA